MAIQDNELVWRKSAVVDDTGSNGGRMSSTDSITGVKNNILPDVSQSERSSGKQRWRKMFILVNNGELAAGGNEGLTLVDPRVFVERQTSGGDMVTFLPGTFDNIQSQLSGVTQRYGCGLLQSAANSPTTTLVVNVEDWATANIFANNMWVRISDKTSVTSGTGNEEYRQITGSGVSVAGNQITLTLTQGLTNSYLANSKVSSVYKPADVACSVHTLVNGTGNTFDITKVTTDNTGTVSDTWTVTFTSPSAFNVVGTYSGASGSGNVGTDFSIINPATSGRYFSILTTAWGAGYDTPDTLSFKTDPAAIPIWYQHDVPALVGSVSGNSVVVAVDGESS